LKIIEHAKRNTAQIIDDALKAARRENSKIADYQEQRSRLQ